MSNEEFDQTKHHFDVVFATKNSLELLKDKIDDVVLREEFAELSNLNNLNSSKLQQMISKDECCKRLEHFNDEI